MKHLKLLLSILLITFYATAKTHYISDSFEVTLRSLASDKGKVIATPKSGEAVTILNGENGWLKVKVRETKKIGWVRQRYVMSRVPYLNQLNYVSGQNAELKSNMGDVNSSYSKLKKKNASLKKELYASEKALGALQTKYANLREGSSDYLALEAERDSIKTDLENKQTKIEELTAENADLKKKEIFYWFIGGAVMFLISYLLGRSARKDNKRRSFR